MLGILGVSAAFATTFVLMVALPIGLANKDDNVNKKYFQGLTTTTDYLVGSNINLSLKKRS